MDDMTDADARTEHPTMADLDAAVDDVLASPADVGTVDLIVRRPAEDERQVLAAGELVVGAGLVGDNYLERGSPSTPDGSAHPEAQLNLMNSRSLSAVSGGDRSRWPLAGDQFVVDLLLTTENLPTGTRLAMGSAVIEVSAKPHNGCAKFARRFGQDAARWVNQHKEQRRRGLNAIVVEPGVVHQGDAIRILR